MNKLFVNPLDSIGRKLRSGRRRRHTTDVVHSLGCRLSKMKLSEDMLPKSQHTSVDYGNSVIPVELIDDSEVGNTLLLLFYCFGRCCCCFVFNVQQSANSTE